MRNLLLFIVVIGTLSFTLKSRVVEASEKTVIASGKTSPTFSFKNNEGKTVNLEDFRGKYVYINLWTSWSNPSLKELDPLQNLIKKYSDKINFINLSVDYQRDINKWKQNIKKLNLKGVHVIADNAWKSEFINTYGVVKIPRAILIDKDGKIIEAFATTSSDNKTDNLLKKLIQ